MKKIKFLLIFLISMFIFNISVFAASAGLSVSSGSVYIGQSFTVTVNINSAAAWNVHVSATGPVSDCVINQADATSDALDTNKTFSAICTATGEGTISINLSGDVTSAYDGLAVDIFENKNVTAITKPVSTPTTPTPTPNISTNNEPITTLSSNTNIKNLEVEGYNLIKTDENNYNLIVGNNVTSLNIKGETEDSKSNITGIGVHKLDIGENKIEIGITAESGDKRTIIIFVVRKEDYKLEDLDALLNYEDDIQISVSNDSKISKSEIEKIKNSKKIVNLNYYDENKKILYSWSIDGSKVINPSEFITTVEFEELNADIYELSNYADGKYINFKHSGYLPKGTKIKLYVGDKFKDESIINIYYYNEDNNSLDTIKKSLKVKSGYVEFNLEHCSKYFVTMANIKNDFEVKKNVFKWFIGVSLIEFLIIVFLVILYIKKSYSIKKGDTITENNNINLSLNEKIETNNSNSDETKY